MRRTLDFETLREANVRRTEEVFHPVRSWSPTDWACAMGGECGEALNLVKKLHRGDFLGREDEARLLIGDELADLILYGDLLAERLDINLSTAVASKFNRSSGKYGSTVLLIPGLMPIRG